MFLLEEASDLNSNWFLGDKKGQYAGCISKHLVKAISNAHLTGLQFLFNNFVNKRGGAILNQDEDMNMHLQVSTFLSSVKEIISVDSPVLIISPEHALCKWHYHLTESGFNPKISSNDNVLPSEVCIMAFDSLKLADQLVDCNMSCVVIDDLDTIALKLVIRKLKGGFNIGLTKRNFYKHPDQKLKWSILNWASPGCVGKLNDFYSIDRLHFFAHADNYRFWWLCLTWSFCETFEPPSDDDIKEYQQKLVKWGEDHKINYISTPRLANPKRKLKNVGSAVETKRKRKYVKRDNKKLQDMPSTSNSSSSGLYSETKSKEDSCNGETMNMETQQTDETTSSSQSYSETKSIEDSCIKETMNMEIQQTDETASLNISDQKQISNTENDNSKDLGDSGEDTEIDENSYTDEIFTIQPKSSNSKLIKTNLESDEEEPIVSFITSQVHQPEVSEEGIAMENKKLSQSSESEGDFLSSIVKSGNISRNFYRSQEISNILEHLSDIEENAEENSDDSDDFLNGFISGKN